MTALKLVIFDVDGTLIDSQSHIVSAMDHAFRAQGLTPPSRARTLSIVGLSLPVAMARLAPQHPDLIDPLVTSYKDAFAALRTQADGTTLSPLYPGAMECLHTLRARDDVFLAVATGKSRRGLDHVFDLHSLEGMFHSAQCADDHPSKPHPSMVAACLRDTGVDAVHAVMVGDTTFDIDMGRAAGIHTIGVAWGYHAADDLRAGGAADVVEDFADLIPALDTLWGAE